MFGSNTSVSRRSLLAAAGGSLLLSACGSNSTKSTVTPTPTPSHDLPVLMTWGDSTLIGNHHVYLNMFAPDNGGVSHVAVLDSKLNPVHHVWDDKVQLANMFPWQDQNTGKKGFAYFRQVLDLKPNYVSFRRGEYVVTDENLVTIDKIRTIKSQKNTAQYPAAEMHDFVVLGEKHYLVQDYIESDYRYNNGYQENLVYIPIIQEIKNGHVVWEWIAAGHHELDNFPSNMKDMAAQTGGSYDYLHMNAMSVDTDGNIIASFRSISTIVKISRKTGALMWILGGKHNQFKNVPSFQFQHDARIENGIMTMFDNGTSTSKALTFAIDEKNKTVSNVMSYTLPNHFSAYTGSVRFLPNDKNHVSVGWGSNRNSNDLMTIFDKSSNAKFKIVTPDQTLNIYRAFVA